MNGLKISNVNSINREKSLSIQMVSFVFNILMSAGTLTGAIFIFLHGAGLLPTSGATIFFIPLITLFVSIIVGTSISVIASEKGASSYTLSFTKDGLSSAIGDIGKVTFTTSHFSQFAVAYVTKTFDDLEGSTML